MSNLLGKRVCPLCKKEAEFRRVLLLENVFVSGDVFEFRPMCEVESLEYAKGDCTMDMCQCAECGLVYNFAFNLPKMLKAYSSEEYYQQLNFTQRTSKTIEDIRDLILRYTDDSVFLEVAPGHCDLVVELSKSAKYIYTIDPSPITQARMPSNIQHIKGFFDAEILRQNLKHKVDFVIFRHLLEHIETPREFLESIVDLLEVGGKIYVEVPNAETIFKNETFYDFYHEHVNYFTQNTLINVFGELGCECVDSISLYEGQHMGFVFAKTQNPIKGRLKPIMFDNVNFTPKIQKFNSYLKDYQSISLWGGGIHSNTLLEFIDREHLGKIKKCVDLNPEKQGRFLQQSQIEIVGLDSEVLREIDCIVMSMTLHEEVVVKTEIARLLEEGKLPNLKAVILSAKELRLIKIKENKCKI